MPQANSYLSIPLQLDLTGKADPGPAAAALAELLQPAGDIEVNGKTYSLIVTSMAGEAEQRLRKPEDQWKADPVPKHLQDTHPLWLTIKSSEDPTRPAMLIRETARLPEFMELLQERLTAPDNAALVDKCAGIFNISGVGAFTVQDFLCSLALHEVMDDIADDLRSLPYSEKIDLDTRGGYLKEPFGVDPVESIMRLDQGPNALLDAAIEYNIDYISSQDTRTADEAMKAWASASEDLEPVLQVLGVSLDAAQDRVHQWTREVVEFSGSVELELEGNCAVTALPFIGKEPMHITFDGITSSRMNAVTDENYFAMLDLLRVDLRGWVDHLLIGADLPAANWDIDIQAMIDTHRPQMTKGPFGYEVGGHHELSKLMAEEIKTALFPAPAGYNRPDDDWAQATWDYTFDIALQVLLVRGEDLDQEWTKANGIDKSKLLMATSSKVNPNLDRYPQLAEHPQYRAWVERLAHGTLPEYEWQNPPGDKGPASLVTHQRLCEVLDNANYSGNVVIAFEADLDNLREIAAGMTTPGGKEVCVSNAYLHVHNFGVGSGDGIPLDGQWKFHTDDLQTQRIRLDNDCCDDYGITAVFGEFLATSSSVVVRDSPAPHKELYAAMDLLEGANSQFQAGVITPLAHSRSREAALAAAITAIANEHNVKLSLPLQINSLGEFTITGASPKPGQQFKYAMPFGKEFADLLTAHDVRCGTAPGAILGPEANWCYLNHFNAERLVNDYVTTVKAAERRVDNATAAPAASISDSPAR